MTDDARTTADPHADAQVLAHGATLDEADAALILLHGRGAPAATICCTAAAPRRRR